MTDTPDSPQNKPPSPLDRIVEQRLKDREARGVTSDTPPKQVATGNIHNEIRRMKQDSQQLGHAAKVRRKHRTAPSGSSALSPAQQLYNELLQEKYDVQGGGKYTPEELFDKLSSFGHIYRLSGRGKSGLYVFSNEEGAVASEMEKLGIFYDGPPGPFTKGEALNAIGKNPAAIIALMPQWNTENDTQKINEYEARIILEKLERKGHIRTPERSDLVIDNFSSAAAADTLTPAQKEEFLAAFNPEIKSDLTPFELTKSNIEKSIRKHISDMATSMLQTHVDNIKAALPGTHPVKKNSDLTLDGFSSASTSDSLTSAQKEEFTAAFNAEMNTTLSPSQLDKTKIERVIQHRVSYDSSSMLYTHLYKIRNALPDTHPVKIKAEEILMDDAVTIPTQAMIDAVEKSGCRSGKKNINGTKCTVINPFELLDSIMKSPECFEPLSNDTITLTPTDIVLGLAKRGYIYDVAPINQEQENELHVRGAAAIELLQNLGLTLESRPREATKTIQEPPLIKLIGEDAMEQLLDTIHTASRINHHVSFQR